MPISSLPSPYGIGTLGKAAYEFIDFLVKSNQKYWQLLPVGPTSYGDSPYRSFSTFAGNPYFIDLDMLIEDGLLTKDDVDGINWGESEESVDYGALYNNRFTVLKKARDTGLVRDAADFARFVEANKEWLVDYALYMLSLIHI